MDRNQREIKSETPDSIVETLNTNSEIEHYLKENLELQGGGLSFRKPHIKPCLLGIDEIFSFQNFSEELAIFEF